MCGGDDPQRKKKKEKKREKTHVRIVCVASCINKYIKHLTRKIVCLYILYYVCVLSHRGTHLHREDDIQ